jgi:hypothetical protein
VLVLHVVAPLQKRDAVLPLELHPVERLAEHLLQEQR